MPPTPPRPKPLQSDQFKETMQAPRYTPEQAAAMEKRLSELGDIEHMMSDVPFSSRRYGTSHRPRRRPE